jgi:hypothetical protein
MARPTKPPTDFDVVVTLDITPTGVATNAQAQGQDIKKSDVLKFCVENALSFVRYPAGPEMLSLEVEIAWAAPDMVSTSARVVGHHEARGSNIDL